MNKDFKDPVSGDTIRFTKTSAETRGEMLEIEAHYRPHSARPPLHYHPHQREHFEIVAGSMTVQLNGDERVYHSGESFDVPPGTAHAMWNAGETTAQVIWQIHPALNSQTFFETVWGLNQDGKFGDKGSPNLLQGAVLMRAYEDEFRLVSPPHPIQQVLFALLAPIGRLLGYRARYARYSG